MAPTESNAESGSAVKVAETAQRGAPAEIEIIEALRRENEELRRNSRYRSQFLSRLAHELRTPLTSILGFSEILLSQERLTDAQRGFCERIQSSAQQLQASLNQLSDLARLDSTHGQLSPERIPLTEILRDVAPALTRPLEKKRLKLSWTEPDNLPAIVSDRARVRVIIYNILLYAISRSGEGTTIFVSAAVNADGFSFTVRDSGEPLADPARIGLLEVSDNSTAGELGLSIAYQHVQLMGGAISARNLQGEVELIIDLPNFPGPSDSQFV